MNALRRFLAQRWFLVTLLAFITGGLWLGSHLSYEQLKLVSRFEQPRLTTTIVLFLMGFSLDSRQLGASFRAPKPVVWASLVNQGFIPVLAWGMMYFQQTPDFMIGLMIAATVPCTVAAASVWTRKAGGNDAVSLLVTVLTNGLCFLITPFWLNLTTIGGVQANAEKMVLPLVWTVLVPTLSGQMVRQIPAAGRFATAYKTPIGVLAQACILTLVFFASTDAGDHLAAMKEASVSAIAIVWVSCIIVHLAGMAVGVTGARWLGCPRRDQIAVAFACSQKTLPIGLLLATDPAMFGNPDLRGTGVGVPFALFPMLMYHGSQLFIDTAVADRFRGRQVTGDR